MGKSAKAEMQVTEFFLTMHVGLGVEIDALLEIAVGEKRAWIGEATSEQALVINAPGLFGGIKKEGGVRGYAYFLPGGPQQTIPNSLAARFGLTRETCPGFRGVSTVFFVGDEIPDAGWTPIPGTSGGSLTWRPPGGGGGPGNPPSDLLVSV